MRNDYGDSAPLAPLLEALLTAGLVRSIDEHAVAPAFDGNTRHGHRPTWAKSLFAWPALAIYAVIVMCGTSIGITHPHYVLGRAELMAVRGDLFASAIALLIALVAVAKHEAAHYAAARFLGVDARFTYGRRWLFPVVCTDLTDVCMVSRGKRNIAFCAGMASDLIALAAIMIAFRLSEAGLVWVPPRLLALGRLSVFVLIGMLAWQLNVFLKTDLYYVLVNAMGVRNLDADSKRYLRALFARIRGQLCSSPVPRTPVIRAYAAAMVAGAIGWIAVAGMLVVQTVDNLRSGSAAETRTAAFLLGVNGAMLLAAVFIERFQVDERYRVRISDRTR